MIELFIWSIAAAAIGIVSWLLILALIVVTGNIFDRFS